MIWYKKHDWICNVAKLLSSSINFMEVHEISSLIIAVLTWFRLGELSLELFWTMYHNFGSLLLMIVKSFWPLSFKLRFFSKIFYWEYKKPCLPLNTICLHQYITVRPSLSAHLFVHLLHFFYILEYHLVVLYFTMYLNM